MGAQAILAQDTSSLLAQAQFLPPTCIMAPMKAAMKGSIKAMSKGAMAKAVAEEHELKQTVVSKIISSLAEIGTKEVTSTGKFTFPGLVMIKTRKKPATKACKKEVFGKMCDIKARPARTIVKAFPVSALKKSV